MPAAVDTASRTPSRRVGRRSARVHLQSQRLLIGAERPEATDGRTFATLDPQRAARSRRCPTLARRTWRMR